MEKKDTCANLLQLRINGVSPNRLGQMLGLIMFSWVFIVLVKILDCLLVNVDNCKVIIYLSGSYKKKVVFLYDIRLKLIEFWCFIISFLLFSNLLHRWMITWMLLILFLGFTFNLLWIQKCMNSLKTRESISLKGGTKEYK